MDSKKKGWSKSLFVFRFAYFVNNYYLCKNYLTNLSYYIISILTFHEKIITCSCCSNVLYE